jgi:hypothetical protein
MPLHIRRAGGRKPSRVFCEELSRLLSVGSFPARIIQRVTVAEGNKSGNESGPWFRAIAQRSLLAGVTLLLGITYAADYCVFRYRLATKGQPFGSVTVEHYDAVPRKDGKTELIFDPPVQKTCVRSLFPHAGDPPCWFLSRHAEQRTDM